MNNQHIKIVLSPADAAGFEKRKQAPDSMFYAAGQREKERILAAAFAQAGINRAAAQWDYTAETSTINIFPSAAQPYEKEFMTCSICRKYKGCWSDSEVCSECDEAEDERKMAENEVLNPEPAHV